jgi:hypothetical protein
MLRRFIVASAVLVVLLPAAHAQQNQRSDGASLCPAPLELISPRQSQEARVREVSRVAELVAPGAAISSSTIAVDALVSPARRRATTPPSSTVAVNYIDTILLSRMKQDGVVATGMATDDEFLRRVTLDLTGAIPDRDTVLAFLADTTPNKREKMIDQLLASDAFVDRWTMWLGDIVQNVQTSANVREYYYGRNAYYASLKAAIQANQPYDQIVRDILAGKGDSFAVGNANYVVRQLQPNGPIQDTYDNLSSHSGERFLGMPLLCLSCHNGLGHLELVNQYLQKKLRYDFWKNAAFFARTSAKSVVADPAVPNVRKFDVEDTGTGNYMLNTTSGNKTARAPQTGMPNYVTPAFILTGEQPRDGEPWRTAYGRMLTAHPQFARATVNYLWKEMFGLGLVEPVNSFDLARLDPANLPAGQTVQPLNPDLLNALTNDFIASKYDLRAMLKTMAMSASYQRSSRYTPGPWNEQWTPYFARHYPHRLQSESLLDAIVKATGVPVTFTVNGIGTVSKAMALPDTIESRSNAYGRFLDELGRGDRDTTARSSDSSIAQSLSMMNDGTVVVNRVHRSNSATSVARILTTTQDPATITDQLYLSTLSRHPTPAEQQTAVNYLKSGTLGPKTEDLQYVLLNSLEFLFN